MTYPDAIRIEAVRLVIHEHRAVADVAAQKGIHPNTVRTWVREHSLQIEDKRKQQSLSQQHRRLKADLKRVTDERNFLGKAALYFAKQIP